MNKDPMNNNQNVYRTLQKHLDRQAVGFPATREDLYDHIMANKKGSLGKLKLTGKLVKDVVITGNTQLLK